MKYDKDIAALTIRNIATIESSLRVIKDVEEVLFKAISATIEKAVKSSGLELSNDQAYNFDVANDTDIHFGTKSWESNPGELFAWIWLSNAEEKDDDGFYFLTHALGEYHQSAKLQLRFEISMDYFREQTGQAPQSFKKNMREALKKQPDLLRYDFDLGNKGGYLFYEFHLDKELVASEYPDLKESLLPVQDAINKVIKAHPHLEELLNEVLQRGQNS